MPLAASIASHRRKDEPTIGDAKTKTIGFERLVNHIPSRAVQMKCKVRLVSYPVQFESRVAAGMASMSRHEQ